MFDKSFDRSLFHDPEHQEGNFSCTVARHQESILAGCKVLVAHDSPEIALVLLESFAAVGARVTAARESHYARLLVAWGGYEMIFLDMAIPEADQVLDLIRDCRPDLLRRTVALTGDLRNRHEVAALKARYPECVFQQSLLVDLAELAATVLARDGHLQLLAA